MSARTWTIASLYGDPAAYGIPELPEWSVRTDGGGLALAEAESAEPFISAEEPVRVRR